MKLSGIQYDISRQQPRSPSHTFVNAPHKVKEPINLLKSSNLMQENPKADLYDYQQIALRVNELTTQLEKLDEVIKVQGDEIEYLRSDNLRLRRGSVTRGLDPLQEENTILKRNLEILDQEKQHQQEHFTQQLKQYQEMIDHLERACSSRNETDETRVRSENVQLNRCIVNKNQEIDYLTSQLQELSEQLSCKGRQGTQDLVDENAKLHQQISYLQEQFVYQVDQLEDKIRIVLKENDRLQQVRQGRQVSDLLASCEQLLAAPEAAWKQQNVYLKEQLQNLLEEFKLLKGAYDAANEQIVSTELEKGNLTHEVKKVQGLLEKEQLATQAVHAQLLQCREEKTMLEHQNLQLTSQVTHLGKSNEGLKLQVVEMADMNQQRQAIIDKLGEYGQIMNMQLSDKRASATNIETELAKMKCKLQTYERENKYLQGQCQNFKANRNRILQQFNSGNRDQIKKLQDGDVIKQQLLVMMKSLEKQT